jgi:peptide deformylase
LDEQVEVESGKRSDRPVLTDAIQRCRETGATLLVAKLDRLSRNLHFITTLQQSKVNFLAVDNPHATPFLIHILVAVAEYERTMISTRTKSALEAAKKRGVRLGNPVIQKATGTIEAEEGCLSLPGLHGLVKRNKAVQVNAYSMDGKEINLKVEGFLARIIQHEVDHLDGVLFIDRLFDQGPKVAEEISRFEARFAKQREEGHITDDQKLAEQRQDWLDKYSWLVLFIPLVISSGGNSGSQSSTLIISALITKDIDLRDWSTIVRRELIMGLILPPSSLTRKFLATKVASAVLPEPLPPMTSMCGKI